MKQKFATTKSRPLPKKRHRSMWLSSNASRNQANDGPCIFYLPKTTCIYSILYSRTAYYLLLLAMLTCVFKTPCVVAK